MSFSKRFMSGSPFRVDKANVKVPAKIKAPVETPMTESEKKLMHATMSVNDKYAVDLGTGKNTKKKDESPLSHSKPFRHSHDDGEPHTQDPNESNQSNQSIEDILANVPQMPANSLGEADLYNLKNIQGELRENAGISPDFRELIVKNNSGYDGTFNPKKFKVDNSTSRSRAAWNQHGDDLNSLTAAQQKLEDAGEKGSNQWNINQNKINELYGVPKRHPVIEEEIVNPDNVEVITDVVDANAHVPAEGINVMSRKQRRAAKRVAKLQAKNRNQGSLTEGQSKKLNRNISKAKGEDVAMADRTKLGQIAKQAGDALGIIPDEEEVV